MGTRSDIIAKCTDGKYRRIYCHWDGYLSHNGLILFDHYNTQERVEKLIALGDLSSLAPSPDKPRGHTFEKPVKGYCVAYGRDRSEKDTKADEFDNLHAAWPEEDTWTEFTYVWEDGRWLVGAAEEGTQSLRPLEDALRGDAKIAPRVQAFGRTIGKHSPLQIPLI